ncbi:hypothetical protein ColTof4_14022 [Colletotrichum tofieldiae]|nr:hypothetical protein ColTof3_14656 [Colletotrichum tofieldiae]GKT81599.1 hypothetical protein ColTof4_14022 [Colletotrichum tofieldiae]
MYLWCWGPGCKQRVTLDSAGVHPALIEIIDTTAIARLWRQLRQHFVVAAAAKTATQFVHASASTSASSAAPASSLSPPAALPSDQGSVPRRQRLWRVYRPLLLPLRHRGGSPVPRRTPPAHTSAPPPQPPSQGPEADGSPPSSSSGLESPDIGHHTPVCQPNLEASLAKFNLGELPSPAGQGLP